MTIKKKLEEVLAKMFRKKGIFDGDNWHAILLVGLDDETERYGLGKGVRHGGEPVIYSGRCDWQDGLMFAEMYSTQGLTPDVFQQWKSIDRFYGMLRNKGSSQIRLTYSVYGNPNSGAKVLDSLIRYATYTPIKDLSEKLG